MTRWPSLHRDIGGACVFPWTNTHFVSFITNCCRPATTFPTVGLSDTTKNRIAMHPSHPFVICNLDAVSLRNILDNVSAPDALMWSQTNRFWRRLCREHFRGKLVTLLKVYLDDAQSFRELMRETGSVLGGSEAIDFALQGSNLPQLFPHDLDIFVGVFHALQVVVYLRDREGYRVFPDDSDSPYLWIYDREFGRVETVTLVHLKKRTRIQVVCCSRSTPLFSVIQNWSTLHMTILTADMLVVPYPTLTFAGEGLFTEVHSNDKCARGHKAAGYRRRGFRIGDFSRNRVSNSAIDSFFCRLTCRRGQIDESDPNDVQREQVLNHPAYAVSPVALSAVASHCPSRSLLHPPPPINCRLISSPFAYVPSCSLSWC